MRNSRLWLIAAALILVVVVLGANRDSGDPLDPESTGPLGTKALVETLEELGAQVDIGGTVSERATSALLLSPPTDQGARELVDWASAGGVIVVPLRNDPLGVGAETGAARPWESTSGCTIDAISQADRPDPIGFRIRDEWHASCFSDGEFAVVVERELGSGSVVTVGGSAWLTNTAIDDGDHAALAVWLLAPAPESATVSVIYGSDRLVAEGDGPTGDLGFGVSSQSTSELISPSVENGMWMALAALAMWAIARAARLGKVVPEPIPVPIRGSELVFRSGHLWRRSRDPGGAAQVIRGEAVTRWGRRLDATPDQVGAVLEVRGDIDPADVAVALSGPVETEEALVDLVARVQRIDRVVEARPGRQLPEQDPQPGSVVLPERAERSSP